MRRIVTNENSIIYAYDDYSVEYHMDDPHLRAVELPNGFAGAREPCVLRVWGSPGQGNYVAYKNNAPLEYLPSWWVAG